MEGQGHIAARAQHAATPIAFVQTILQAYEKYDADPAEALRLARIGWDDLQRPDTRVTALQLEIITGFAMRQLDDEALGWFSRKLPWGTYGMLCRASRTSPNLCVALKRWCRHHRLLTQDIILDLSVNRAIAQVTIRENRRLREARELCLLTNLRQAHGYACWAINARIPLHGAEFPFPAPRHADAYDLLYKEPVHFGADHARISFDAQYLSLPLRRDERALQNMLRRALPLTVRQYRSDRLMVLKLRDVLRTRCTELHAGESAASALNISLRTLHRRLLEEGTSLQQVKDEVRRDLAAERLVRTSRSIKQVANEVGFHNAKSFTRAFKQWTGMSPVEYRRDRTAPRFRVSTE